MYCQFIYCLISYFKVQINLAVVAVTFRLTLLSQVNARNVSLETLYGGQFSLSNKQISPNLS